MKAARVHSVLVGGVQDPRRLLEWAEDPQALRSLGVDPASLDLDALRLFSGMALKVRHNGLRASYPHSFRLLDVAGLEIEVFAAYALDLAVSGAPLGTSDEARAQAFIDFVRDWHDPRKQSHVLLFDLLHHEQALSQLASAGGAATGRGSPSSTRPAATSVPRVRGAVRLHELGHDPRTLVDVLRQREPDLGAIALAPCSLCYWRPPGAEGAGIVELDAFGFAVIQATDGRRSVADITAGLGLGRRVPARVLRLLAQLQDAGLLAFAARRRPASRGPAG